MNVSLPRDIDRQFVTDLEAVLQWRDGLDGAPPLTVRNPGAPAEVIAAVKRISIWRRVDDSQPPQSERVPLQYLRESGKAQSLPVSATWRDDVREGATAFLDPAELAARRGWPTSWRHQRLLPDDVSHNDLVEVLGAALISRHGVLGTQGDRFQCHLCGLWVRVLAKHVSGFHGVDRARYVEEFGVYISGARVGQNVAVAAARADADAKARVAEKAAAKEELFRRRAAAAKERAETRRQRKEQEREHLRRHKAAVKTQREAERERLRAAITEQRRQQSAVIDQRRQELRAAESARRAAEADKLQERIVSELSAPQRPRKPAVPVKGRTSGTRAPRPVRQGGPTSAQEWDELLQAHGYSDLESAIRAVVLAGGSHSDLAVKLDVRVGVFDRRVKELRGFST